jgi:hypothetical protein
MRTWSTMREVGVGHVEATLEGQTHVGPTVINQPTPSISVLFPSKRRFGANSTLIPALPDHHFTPATTLLSPLYNGIYHYHQHHHPFITFTPHPSPASPPIHYLYSTSIDTTHHLIAHS